MLLVDPFLAVAAVSVMKPSTDPSPPDRRAATDHDGKVTTVQTVVRVSLIFVAWAALVPFLLMLMSIVIATWR